MLSAAFLFFFAGISIIYIAFTILLTIKWWQIPTFTFQETPESHLITLIIPVRNEAENILGLLSDLHKQSYRNFEVIIIDDNSEDATSQVINKFQKDSSFSICLHPSNRERSSSPKKAAIKQGIALAEGQLILTTDGDCRVSEHWLRDMHSFYCLHKPKLISSGVTFHQETSGFERMQTVEFMSLIGAGAVSMHLKSPNMCNGANLMYQKSAFLEVGGFAGSEKIASGDDEFLMHKIYQQFPDEVMFLKSQETTVRTRAHKTLNGFIQQRKRWASKWNHYTNWQAIATAIFIFGVHFSHLLGILALFIFPEIRLPLLSIFIAKVITEFWYLRSVLHFYGHGKKDRWILATQLFHSLYIVLIGASGKMGGYQWKGRKLY